MPTIKVESVIVIVLLRSKVKILGPRRALAPAPNPSHQIVELKKKYVLLLSSYHRDSG